MTKIRLFTVAVLLAFVFGSSANAGVFILAGTDADDHGFVSGGVNQDGWFFMQRALENLAPGVTNGNKKVVTIGTSGSTAGSAASSAFGLSTLPGAGWTIGSVDTSAGIDDFFDGVGPHNKTNTGIIMIDSDGNVGGGITAAEQTTLAARAADIDAFLGAGGALFAQSHSYGWLSTLVPGLTITSFSDTGLTLTAAGSAAFPSLTNADLSSGPWHNYFSGSLGGLTILATGPGGQPVIIGASGGSVTAPEGAVPEPASVLVWGGLAAVGLVYGVRRKGRN